MQDQGVSDEEAEATYGCALNSRFVSIGPIAPSRARPAPHVRLLRGSGVWEGLFMFTGRMHWWASWPMRLPSAKRFLLRERKAGRKEGRKEGEDLGVGLP